MAIWYAVLLNISMIFGLIMFPVFHENVQIPLVPLIGLGSWFFGRKTGFMLILVMLVYSFFLTSIIYPHMAVYYEAKGAGIIIMVITASLVGNIRNNYEELKATTVKLDRHVAERNAELSNLTVKLINDVEATRIRHGQTLHDGIGQQLTGIQLYCSSVAEQLMAKKSPNASLAFSMRSQTKTVHDIIRKTARMLFPIRIHETGLIPAISELVSCFNEIKHMSVALEVNGDFREIPDEFSLGLYRICHESALCAATAFNAGEIQLGINETATDYEVTLQYNGSSWSQSNETAEQRLIRYRLQILRGTFLHNTSGEGFEKINYRIPKVS